ncbi:hypothetical protein STENM327S_01628 [Streptomyces tendae]
MVSPVLLLTRGADRARPARAAPGRAARRKGPRELLLMLLHSRYMRIITHPAFAIPLFIASLHALQETAQGARSSRRLLARVARRRTALAGNRSSGSPSVRSGVRGQFLRAQVLRQVA